MNEIRLIDANALKKAIAKSKPCCDVWLDIIDNAPTVNTGSWSEGYHEGFHTGSELGKAFSRPQGKWYHSGECPICHKRSLRTTPTGDIIGIDLTDFCKNCGADLRGTKD